MRKNRKNIQIWYERNFKWYALSNRYRNELVKNLFKLCSLKKKSFFAEYDLSNHLKKVMIFYKMNIMNARCIIRNVIIQSHSHRFFSFSNSWRMINIIAMFNFLTFMNLLRLRIVIAMFNSCRNFSKCFRNRRSHRRRDFFDMWQLHDWCCCRSILSSSLSRLFSFSSSLNR